MAKSLRWLVKSSMKLVAHIVRRRPFRSKRATPPRIAYWIAGGMGDAVMALPALAFLDKQYPGAAIDVYAPRGKTGLVEALLHRPFTVRPITFAGVVLNTLRRRGYDLFLTNTIGTFRLSYEIAGHLTSRYAAGFRYPVERPGDRLFDFSLPIEETSHDIDQNLTLAAGAINMPFNRTDREYPVINGRRSGSQQKIRKVLVHPGAGKDYAFKKWPLENYRTILERLQKIRCRPTVLLGPDEVSDYPFFSRVAGVAISHVHDPASLIRTITASDLFIGNDSGPSHVAALFGIPTITLFGPTNPVRIAAQGENALVITAKTACAPCFSVKGGCSDNTCMKSIGIEEVWREVIGIVHLPQE